MIQRIQSIYLLLGALAVAAVLLFDGVWGAAATAFGWFTFTFYALTTAAGLTALFAIFLYENRHRQRRIVTIAQVLTLGQAAVLYGGLYGADALRVVAANGQVAFGRVAALLLPVAGYVLLYLARRAITSDIELVRSMDRLR